VTEKPAENHASIAPAASAKTARWDSLRQVFVPSFGNFRVWLLQLFGSFIILAAIAGFLRTGETFFQLALGVLLVLVAVVGWMTLDSGTFNYYLDQQRNQTSLIKAPFLRAIKHFLPLLIVAAIFFLLHLWLERLDDYHYSFPGYLRSELPAWLRRHISETRIQNFYDLFLFFLRWIVVPVLLLPLASLCADKGFRGLIAFRIWLRMFLNRLFWGVVIVASVLGVVIPVALKDWKLDPKTASLTGEEFFLAFRIAIATVLILSSWLMVSFTLARARMKAETGETSKTG
jgi:hypothetical protein